MKDELKYVRRLELRTGDITLQSAGECPTVYRYFKTIEDLNQDANVYGCVYLATDLALGLLEPSK